MGLCIVVVLPVFGVTAAAFYKALLFRLLKLLMPWVRLMAAEGGPCGTFLFLGEDDDL